MLSSTAARTFGQTIRQKAAGASAHLLEPGNLEKKMLAYVKSTTAGAAMPSSVQKEYAKVVAEDEFKYLKSFDPPLETDNPHGVLTLGFHENPKAASAINRILERFKQAKLDLGQIIVSVHQKKNEQFKLGDDFCRTQILSPQSNLDGKIISFPRTFVGLGKSSFEPDNDDRILRWLTRSFLKLIKWLGMEGTSSEHSLHAPAHEFTHVLHHRNLLRAGGEKFLDQVQQLKLPNSFWKNVKKHVSIYAAQDKDPQEVIAEIGAAKLVGQKLNLTPDIQEFWNKWWGGADLPFGLLKDLQ